MQLREYAQVLRRRWWIIVLLAAVMAASAFAYARLQTPLYRSSVRLLVSGRFDYGNLLAIEKQLRSLANQVQTTAVAEEVDRRLRLDLPPEALFERLKTDAVPDLIQIEITYDDVDPARAQQVVKAFADVFIEQHTARQQPLPRAERVEIQLRDRPTPPVLFWPQTRVLVLAAGLIGLVVGTLLAFAIEYLDDTLKTPDDVDRYVGLVTVGVVPQIPPDELLGGPRRGPPATEPSRAGVADGGPRP
jgi:capsular polysaccharide biosynthesis protein